MPSAIADPDELEQFAAALCRFQDALKENTAMMNSAPSTDSAIPASIPVTQLLLGVALDRIIT